MADISFPLHVAKEFEFEGGVIATVIAVVIGAFLLFIILCLVDLLTVFFRKLPDPYDQLEWTDNMITDQMSCDEKQLVALL